MSDLEILGKLLEFLRRVESGEDFDAAYLAVFGVEA